MQDRLLSRIEAMNASGEKRMIRTWSRSSTIFPDMYEFLDRLASIALPRIRDFRGLDPGSFDGRGNYSIGIREQIIFPEIDYDQVPSIRGLDVAITTSAESDEHGRALLAALGLPLAGEERRDQ